MFYIRDTMFVFAMIWPDLAWIGIGIVSTQSSLGSNVLSTKKRGFNG